ncbi:MAG: tRNA lysidine(34) synthetase TilS [Vicinamibacterales bacterium]
MRLAARVHAFSTRYGLWQPGDRVVAAVSGGADSVALAWLLHDLAGRGALVLAGLAHLHHHVRGTDADDDAAFVQALAARLGVACEVGHADVPALARESGRSLEVAGRDARLAFFAEVLPRFGATRLAIAHTRTDQAETVLLRLVRGAGSRGLAAMAPVSGVRVRPLLDVGREELRQWLTARGERWREDSTNLEPSTPRNRLRHEVMPVLSTLHAGAERAVARAARSLAEDAACLDELAADTAARAQTRDGGRVRLDLRALARLPPALARRVVRGALETLDPAGAYGWEDTEAVLHGTGRRLDLGRVLVERNRHTAVLFNRGDAAGATPAVGQEGAWALPVPGVASHPARQWEVEAAGPLAVEAAPQPDAFRAVLDAEALGRHLTVRGWQPGDRVQPLGMRGRKKLQDVFVDRKVPFDERGFVPVVLDGRGRIAWVAGHVVGEPFRVTPRSVAVVVLTLRR